MRMATMRSESRPDCASRLTKSGSRPPWRSLKLITLLVVALVSRGVAAEPVGSIAAIEVRAEIRRGGAWQPAALGDAVEMGDVIRTDDEGRVRLVLADSSVVVVASKSEISIDQHVFRPDDNSATSLLQLLGGKVRAIVSEYYKAGGSFEVRTRNSISGVRGTDFVVVHDVASEVSEVIGVSGAVSVRGLTAAAVEVTAMQLSTIEKDRDPSSPVTLTEEQFRYYLDGLEFVGGGRPESLLFNQPVLVDDLVPKPERASDGAPAAVGALGIDEVPDENDVVGPEGAGLAGEPADAVDSGDVGIRF